MYVNKSSNREGASYCRFCYRCNCGPYVNEPSEKGPVYWYPPPFIPTIYKAKALGNTKTPGTNILSQSTIEHCMKKYMYLWLNNGTEFWSVPRLVKNSYVYLWIWNDDGWKYDMLHLKDIDCFMCY